MRNMKENKPVLAGELYRIASPCCYFDAICFYVAAIIGKNWTYSLIGATEMLLGTLFLVLSKRNGKSDDDSGECLLPI